LSQLAIVVENLSKHYRINGSGVPAYHRLSEALTGVPKVAWYATRKLLASSYTRDGATEPPALAAGLAVSKNTRGSQATNDFWALKDINFEIKQGEVVGIIGRNGAGKSTLLKILSRITEPTSGKFGVRGRVASLLEVGTGFHPELNGRENIYVSGITLGMTRAEIKKRFDEIVDFSGVEKFLDTPVKHYSSGMQVRLGFAVAAHLESEILIVDEVLAVGDAEFQKKCMGTMGRIAAGGRSILMVSHNLISIRQQCSTAILITRGRIEDRGSAGQVVDRYSSKHDLRNQDFPTIVKIPDFGEITNVQVVNSGNQADEVLSISKPIHLDFNVNFSTGFRGLYSFSLHVFFEDGNIAFATVCEQVDAVPNGCVHWRCTIPADLLNDGNYSAELVIVSSKAQALAVIPDFLHFSVSDLKPRDGWYGRWPGLVRPNCNWTHAQELPHKCL